MAKKKSVPKKKKKPDDGGVFAALKEIDRSNSAGVARMDDALAQLISSHAVRQAFNDQVVSANTALANLICLRMPALAPRFFLQGEGWPLSRFVMIVGVEESCKSALTFEIGTWHRRAGGNMAVIETEQKDSPPLMDSFFNYDRNAWFLHRARTQEEWNKAFVFWADQFSRQMDGWEEMVEDPKTGKKKKMVTKGLGRVVPCCLSIDSMSAVVLGAMMEQIMSEGTPSLQHPIHAKLLADFFRAVPKLLTNYPITLLAVNHLKHSQDKRNPNITIENTTGGQTPKFEMSMQIEMRRRGKGQMVRAHPQYGEVYSIDLEMRMKKNSLAPHENLGVEMCWYFDPDDIDPITNEKRQHTYFDWDSASIELLLQCGKTGDSGGKGFTTRRAKELADLIDLHQDNDRRVVWSKRLGIPEKRKESFFVAGRILEDMIQSDQQFADDLYGIMGIKKRFLFEPGNDWRDQADRHMQRLKAQEAATVTAAIQSATAEQASAPAGPATEGQTSPADPLSAPPVVIGEGPPGV